MKGVEARTIVEAAVRRELFGPAPGEGPVGTAIDCSGGSLNFEAQEETKGPFHDRDTFEEVLTRSDPLRRYGIGVLYSGATPASGGPEEDPVVIPGLAESEDNPEQPPPEIKGPLRQDEADSDDFDLSDANRRKPSAMAISFKVRVHEGGSLRVRVTGAYYDRVRVTAPDTPELTWWVRRPFTIEGTADWSALLRDRRRARVVTAPVIGEPKIAPRIVPSVTLFNRAVPNEREPDLRLVTIAVVNDVQGTGPGSAFFQLGFTVEAAGGLKIEPYPDVEQPDSDEEEQSIALLYRYRRTFAIGHGCAADWSEVLTPNELIPYVQSVSADAMPAYEVTSLTPDVYEEHTDGSRTSVSVSMEELSLGSDEGRAQVEKVLSLYGQWIADRRESISDLPDRYRDAANRHMDMCAEALERMEEGWQLAQSDTLAARAFRLANSAMLYQQLRSRLPIRELVLGSDDIYRPQGPHPEPVPNQRSGRWRAFQIGFVLASLPEIVFPEHPRRTLVDLIFFPTGGGKTEAYLGASAISLLARRLRNKKDAGTDTLMRYTLRLLTAQQFLRASSLICVLEDLRSQAEDELGTAPFGIGVWLGGDSTPNTWKAAERSLKQLRRDYYAPNQFLLLKCPWCGTRMKPIRRAKGQDTPGYVWTGTKVVLRCVDEICRFGGKETLPVHVVDEDIYDARPAIVIGTVDKFATMAWQPAARKLFGLGEQGERVFSPPGLIIQDELHLISGPLGSMVGLYEPVIDDLTTERRDGKSIQSKIIASTATVRRYEDQIKGLFGRDKVALFPPHGLEEGRSFFAEPATLDDGTPAPGRRYLGIMSSSLGSTQTVQVRVAAATLQAGPQVPDVADRDGYWTNLNFLNSLRELGNTLSLIQSDIPDYLVGLQRRDGITPRWPRNTMELTSRRRGDEIPEAIEELEVSLPKSECVDVCLASNIIEVGVDIERLGLMTIVGQPKTTAQYIQVSGRVGRNPKAPGLVLTIYGASKPRDRSHYERFRTYHQQLYAQVEPTSVTPFAEPVLKRAMHAAAISRIRQLRPGLEPNPFPRTEFDEAVALLRARAALVDPDELATFDYWVDVRAREWERGERTNWAATTYFRGDPKQGLMRPAGELADPQNKNVTWDTPMSMRSVDAECRLDVTRAYVIDDMAIEQRP
ncbi:helicase [Mycobacterium sp. 852002-51613_SCH5001154]|uniref:helicase-related protein n=1 Tax=Mycobacterium sp. 852002-51613_SCH5001154 TaxID=1834104 RepID=UPI0008008AE1|nr:helicase-related protein [Mycobacterium sp. 852002-51613_SCH5001154]OBF70431.1 helicase [Mycobacterium sp. 852002-51613_SCH5001154]